MGKHVVAGEPPVGDKDRIAAIRVTVDQLAERGKFIFLPARLDDYIQIPLGKQVKQ